MLEKVQDKPIVKDMLAEAAKILGFDVLKLCSEGPVEKLMSTHLGQPALYVADMVAVEKLREEKSEVVENCAAVAGLSSGEIAALAAAGVFSFADGLKLTLKRAEFVQEASNLQPQYTLSIAGLAEKKVLEICQNAGTAAGDGEWCQVSNFLFEKGYTIAGTKSALEECEKMAKKAKAMQARPLKDQGAFHTPLMKTAKEKYSKVLEEMKPRMSSPRCKVFMNATGTAINSKTDVATIVELMVEQLTLPVKWKDCVQNMLKDGVTEMYECGPGNQLKMMTKRIDATLFDNTQIVLEPSPKA
jgi:[acyl-carrier-protein] S-malonyltransferase